MLNSRVIEILKTFSSGEMKRFGEFLISPFHNKNKKAVILFELLNKYHPEFENKSLTKEKLFTKIFPSGSKQYNDALIRNLLSDLLRLAEKYLAFSRFEKNSFEFNEKILSELNERKLSDIFEKKIKQLSDHTGKSEFEGEVYFYEKFILEELKSSNRQFTDNLRLYKDDALIKASEYLSFYYLIKIFKLVNFFEYQKFYNIDSDSNFALSLIGNFDPERTLSKLKKTGASDKEVKILMVYYRMYRSIINSDNDDLYIDFKNSLFENGKLFSGLERLGLFICLTNCCVKRIDSGKEFFVRECFNVYMLMLDQDLYSYYPGYFPMSAFSAVLHTGLSSGEFRRVENFISSYSSKLNPEHKKDAVNYSMAQICFHKKEYEKALEYIIKTDTDFSQFKFLLKILSLKIYYETEDYESVYYASDSFQHFLNNNKLVGEKYRSEFSNFIKALDLLIKYRTEKENEAKYKLKHFMEVKSMTGKKWLMEKFNEI
jgi:hypothetical protein